MQRRNEKLMTLVAKKLKQLRKDKGLSQYIVYLDTELNIGHIELGKTNISVSTLSILCEYYGISLEEFFKETQ